MLDRISKKTNRSLKLVWNERSVYTRILIAAVAALIGVFALLLLLVFPAVLDVERDLDEFKLRASSLIQVDVDTDQASLSDLLDEIEESTAVLGRRLWFVRQLRSVVSWVPVMGSNINALIWMTDGAVTRVEVMGQLVLAAEDLVNLRKLLTSSRRKSRWRALMLLAAFIR